MPMVGSGRGCGSPSSVTCRSSIASRSAAWVFAGARFTSSASTTLAKTGPSRIRKELVAISKMLVPTISLGMRPGVNWIRLKLPPIRRAAVRASSVFAVGGRQDAIKRCRRIEAVARGEPKAKVTPKTFARDLVFPRAAQESGETADVLEARARRPRIRRKRRAESAARPPQEEEHRCAGQQHCATEPCPLEHGH